VSRRGIDLLALAFALLSLACLVVAFARRHSLSDLPDLEGAYFNRSVGSPRFTSIFSGNQFEPFHPFHAYLWLQGSGSLSRRRRFSSWLDS
jgi:hypothetical protein